MKAENKVIKAESLKGLFSFFLIIVCFLLLYLFPAKSNGQYLGSHLSYSIKEMKVTVTLDQYYDCSFTQIPEEESASIFESMALGSVLNIELKQSNVEQLRNNNSAPCKSVNTCIKKVSYIGEAFLKEVPGGYDIAWRYCCLNQPVNNINVDQSRGFVLQSHIDEEAFRLNNSAPALLSLPPFKACKSYENISIINAMDSIDGDSIEIQFYNVRSDHSISDPSAIDRETPEHKAQVPPPYETLKYQKGFAEQQPLGEGAKLLFENNSIIMESETEGRYLLGITINEYRKKTKISSSQFVFITNLN